MTSDALSTYQPVSDGSSIYQITFGEQTYEVLNGRYPKHAITQPWGRMRRIPSQCGHQVKSRNGAICEVMPTWFQNGHWTCAHHRADKKMLPNGEPGPHFAQFECSICLDTCKVEKNKYVTPCNHYFHKNCMKNWFTHQSPDDSLKCPLCRTVIKKHPFGKRSRTELKVGTLLNSGTVYNILQRYETTYELTLDEQILILQMMTLRLRMDFEESQLLINELLIAFILSNDIFNETSDESPDEFRIRIEQIETNILQELEAVITQ